MVAEELRLENGKQNEMNGLIVKKDNKRHRWSRARGGDEEENDGNNRACAVATTKH